MQKIKYLLLTLFLTFAAWSIAETNPFIQLPVTDTLVSAPVTDPLLLMEDSIMRIYEAVDAKKYNLNYDAFRYAMIGYYSLKDQNKLGKKEIISVIDFTQTSCEKRFYTIDLKNRKMVHNTYVSHGRNSGDNRAVKFSNVPESYASSLGFYVTGETYNGQHGYSLKLFGYEKGYNDQVFNRAIVIHPADYVSESFIRNTGRLGRSYGCPALPKEVSARVINTIKDRTAIFAYYNDAKYLSSTPLLKLEKAAMALTAQNEVL